MKKGAVLGVVIAAALAAAYFLKFAIIPAGEEKHDFGAVGSDRDPVEVGRKIFFGKGRCALCHTLGGEGRGKCPDLEGAGARLTREFIYEALTRPDAYVKLDFDSAEPRLFPARMPTINKPPIGLTEDELLTVIFFIQSQGGWAPARPSELERGQKKSL